MILKAKRVTLRKWKENDAESLYHYAKNPKIGPIANWPPHTSVEDSLNIIKTVFCKPETYAITLEDNIAIGCVGLLVYPDGNYYWGKGTAELGYWIGEEFWGQGLAVEASQILVKRAFDDLDLEKIYATYNSSNFQSKRVLEKLGFKYFDSIDNTDYLGNPFKEIAMVLEKL